jgi:hypothetical protein
MCGGFEQLHACSAPGWHLKNAMNLTDEVMYVQLSPLDGMPSQDVGGIPAPTDSQWQPRQRKAGSRMKAAMQQQVNDVMYVKVPPSDVKPMRNMSSIPAPTDVPMPRQLAPTETCISQEGTAAPKSDAGASTSQRLRTTMIVTGIPKHFTRQTLLELFDREGFRGQYDFAYLPIDFLSNQCLGHAFVNFRSKRATHRFMAIFNGRQHEPGCDALEVKPTSGIQGFAACIRRYRGNPVMHPEVPDEFKPCVFDANGARAEFPKSVRTLLRPGELRMQCENIRRPPGL